ncbi:MAG: cytochrome c family protein [Planctomycetes bacterium]|nr:cytochrome c family protein [Planctomycetota bacterium]
MRMAILMGILLPGLAGLGADVAFAQVPLPGTRPNEAGLRLAKLEQCAMCHSRTKSGTDDPFFSWQAGLMSQAMRDPVFRAALAIANQDVPGVGDYCLRCHTPRGFLQGRTLPPDGSKLTRDDLNGVGCEICHRQVDPLSAAATSFVQQPPPGYGNGMYVVDPAFTVRGPYNDARGPMPHRAVSSGFQASGQLCGVCHNVSNPLQAADVKTQPPHAYGHIERTYSEWLLSDFSKQGPAGACQACHYPRVPGGGWAARSGAPHRDYFVRHGPVGGSTWVPEAILHLWKDDGPNPDALRAGQQRTREMLGAAAALELTFAQPQKASLRITNLTGHKLPTGYPEGRRMWINVRFLNSAGAVLQEIGAYGEKEDTLAGQAVKVPTLLDPQTTRVYECLPAISPAQAQKHGKQPGPSFHFVLNDAIAKDNRIPPQGYVRAAFAEHHCEPVGAEYADGQYWDDVPLDLPAGARRVQVRLMYQSVSWEYLKFFVEENKTDDWSKRLYEAWTKTGRCAPEVMAEITRDVPQ